jgi:anti-sigma factor RsiW
MRCLKEGRENAELLLAYCSGKLDAEGAAAIGKHVENCAACREFVRGQQAVWSALDAWEAAPVSADFDRRLYRRIDLEVSWWDRLIRPFRPMLVRQGIPVAASAFLVIMASVLLDRPAAVPPADESESAQVEALQAEQVEHALDEIEMLHEFNHQMRTEATESKSAM